jgi:hypothetical protein
MAKQLRDKAEWKSEFSANGSTRIEWLVDGNPKRPSGQSYSRFERYFQSPTVEEYLKAGGTKGDLKYDWEQCFLDLHLMATEAKAPIELLEQDPLTIVEEALPVLDAAEDDFAEFKTDAVVEEIQALLEPVVTDPILTEMVEEVAPVRSSRRNRAKA